MSDLAEQNRAGLETPLRVLVWGGAASLLLAPLVAMQFTGEVAWTAFDFLVFAAMLAAAGTALELGARVSSDPFYRAGFALAVASAFFLVWASLAVGLIGAEDNPVNRVYLAVFALLAGGPALARLKSAGMALSMLGAASGFVVIAIVGLGAGLHQALGASVAEILAVNLVFATLFLASAGLFALAGRRAEGLSG